MQMLFGPDMAQKALEINKLTQFESPGDVKGTRQHGFLHVMYNVNALPSHKLLNHNF